MRIAMLTPTVLADGGVTVHVHRSAHALREAGYDVLLVSGDEGACDADVQVPGVGGDALGAPARLQLARTLRERDVQVAHFHNVDDAALVSEVGATVATLVSAHGWSGCGPGTRFFGHGRECHRAHGPGCVPNMLLRNCKHTKDPRGVVDYYRRAERRLRALRDADVAVAHSGAMVDHLANNEVIGAQLVPLPVDGPTCVPAPATGAARVAYVGRLTPVKGVAVLLRGARYFDAQLDICGAGFIRPALERLTERLGLQDRVTFHGWRSADDVESVYNSARVVAVPSVYPEPFGMVGPEAMVRGRPVVASSTGGTADWLQHGRTGLAVAPGDPKALGLAITSLLADPDLAVRMGGAGRQMALERFSVEAHVQAVLAAYRAALVRARMRRAAASKQVSRVRAARP